jgi:hypothetical protein
MFGTIIIIIVIAASVAVIAAVVAAGMNLYKSIEMGREPHWWRKPDNEN